MKDKIMNLREKTEKSIQDQVHLPGAEQILLRILDEKVKNTEALELVLICAKDIVDAWPQVTLRTLGQMTKRIETLRQALEAVSK